jgi:hypothetical protein
MNIVQKHVNGLLNRTSIATHNISTNAPNQEKHDTRQNVRGPQAPPLGVLGPQDPTQCLQYLQCPYCPPQNEAGEFSDSEDITHNSLRVIQLQ